MIKSLIPFVIVFLLAVIVTYWVVFETLTINALLKDNLENRQALAQVYNYISQKDAGLNNQDKQ